MKKITNKKITTTDIIKFLQGKTKEQKKEITFLREENEAVDLKNIIKCKEEM